ncbi:MAG: hypothetical protein H6648_07520 [Caldilineae bacterium]|nr:hypothetical protein [Chloroflexota bacterium]MCB9176992.1 hypothetical protein [Caldilineae bacterium]
MNLEKLAYLILAVAAAAWALVAVFEIEWSSQEGLLVFLTALGFCLLLYKALRERLANAEDDHYDQTVDR